MRGSYGRLLLVILTLSLWAGAFALGKRLPSSGTYAYMNGNAAGSVKLVAGTWNSPLAAQVDISPDSLEKKSQGNPVTAFIQLPTGYDIHNIDAGSLRLCLGTSPCGTTGVPMSGSPQVNSQRLKATFDRPLVVALVSDIVPPVKVFFTVSGVVSTTDGVRNFAGSDELDLVDPESKPAPALTTTPTPMSTSTPSPTATSTPTATPRPHQLIENGDFETGDLSHWVSGGLPAPTVTKSEHHGGKYSAKLGFSNLGTTSYIYQTVTIPSDAPKAVLKLAYLDKLGGGASGKVAVRSENGQLLQTLMTTTENNGSWTTKSFDLSAYKGKTVQIYFEANVNRSQSAGMYVDDVTIDTK